MKRKPFFKIGMILVISLTMIACDLDKGSTDTAPENPDVVNGTTFAVPAFEVSSSHSRGISLNTISGGDFDSIKNQFKVLQSFPIIPSLKPVTVDTSAEDAISKLGVDTIDTFGLTLKLNKTLSCINDDGVFLVMELHEGEIPVVRVEYYYNMDTNRFTYREIAMCTFDGSLYNIGELNMILLLELNDIPVTFKEDGTISYSTCALNADGKNEQNAIMDYIVLSGDGSLNSSIAPENGSTVWRDYRLIKSENNILAAMSLPWWSAHYDFKFYESPCPETLSEKIKTNLGDNYDTWDKTKLKDTDLNFAYSLLDEFYVTQHEEKTWTDYDSFKAASYFELKQWIKEITPETMKNELPVLADIKNSKVYPYLNSSSKNYFSLEQYDLESYISTGFNSVFGSYTEDASGFLNFFATKFLNQCGIMNENYIENFIYSLQDFSWENKFLMEVTTEEPESFRTKYEAKIQNRN